MSFITTCPVCTTCFIVKPEQLSAQHGQVRCGSCQQVFNAFDQLKTITEDNLLPTALDTDATVELTDSNPTNTEETIAAPPPIAETPTVSDETISVEMSPAEFIPSDEFIESSEPLLVNPELITSTEAVPENDDVIPFPFVPTPATPTLDNDDIPTTFNDTDSTPKKKLKAPSKRLITKWIALILVLFLVLLGITQSVYFLRTAIATQWPELKPYLVKACAQINCKVDLAKNIDLLTIDDSDLHEDTERPGLIHLTSTLINNAHYSQAYPKLELTLTDANDAPLLRRTFKPSEYLPASTIVNNGMIAGEEVHIKLSFTTSGEAVAGYRVFVTY